MSNPSAVLEMRGVGKTFSSGATTVLDGVDLSIAAGEFIGLTGPSGSGKSTLLNLASLLDYPTSGSIIFDGQDVDGLNEAEFCRLRMMKIGMVFQKYHLLPHRSVIENVLFRFRYLATKPENMEESANRALDTLGLASIADRSAHVLSGGEMQRVAIARAVALKPRILIADEPTGNLDTASARSVMDHFTSLNGAGITILMATHNERLLQYCSRHIRLESGRLWEVAP